MDRVLTFAFRAGLIAAVIMMTYLMLSKPTANVHGLMNDKVAHFLGFFCLAFVLDGAFPKVATIWKIVLLVAYGLAIELVQLQLSYRHFSWWDWLADIMGVLVYQPLAKPIEKLLRKLFSL